jgi:hypothetical protein
MRDKADTIGTTNTYLDSLILDIARTLRAVTNSAPTSE